MHISRLIFALFLIFSAVSTFAAARDVPGWVKQTASAQTPAYAKDVPAVVLLNEQKVTLDGGKLVTVTNYAVKLLSKEGRSFAVARALYLVSAGKVREINAWLIRPDGTTKEFDKKSVLDVIADPDDIYNEYRIKVIDASSEADTGAVFGYTVVTEDTPLFYHDTWSFQDNLPVIASRYTLNLPSGWRAMSKTFNHAEIAPQVSGTSYTWELRNLAPIPPEPMSPSIRNLAPRVAVNYIPENRAQAANRAFANWTEVSRWASEIYDPQVILDDNVANKARELTADAQTEFDKIRAIGTYVQNLQYISIDIGVGHGNGYRPRPSTTVLTRGYGDCKDKANLMRAMLRVLKIDAYPIAIYSGDPNFVREEWASPDQFNHCIIAVKVSDATQSPIVLAHPKLGRLLIFDATDPFTPVGDLPEYLQGSYALIIAGENGGISKMPVTPAEFNTWNRNVEVDLAGDGSIQGVIREQVNGQPSTKARSLFRSLSSADFNKAIEGWLARGATAARLVKLTPTDRYAQASFDMDIEFAAPRYAQLMQNRLLIFKPAIVNRADSIYLTEPARARPVQIDAESFVETTVFNLPAGFTVDEIPDAVKLETAFGKYSANYETKDGKLIFTRSITTNRSIIEAEKYASVRDFYKQILAAEQAPVVLLKK